MRANSCRLAAVLLLGATVAACGGDDAKEDASAKPTATATAEKTPTATPTVSAEVKEAAAKRTPKYIPDYPQMASATNASQDVRAGRCATEKGRVIVRGTVKNPTSKPADYAITVSWATDENVIRSRKSAIVRRVPAGRTRRWQVAAVVRASNVTQCVFYMERGKYAGA